MNADLFAPPPAPAPEPAPCADCAAWEQRPLQSTLNPSCDDCMARDIAQGPRAWASVVKGDKEPLRLEILHVFKDRALTVGRAKVWEWCQRLQIGGPKA